MLPIRHRCVWNTKSPHTSGAPDATVTYTVETLGDTTQTVGCTGGAGSCTLRGTLLLANNSASQHDYV